MADIFISYRRDDRTKAEALAKALKLENLDVWWDAGLETGETFDEKIQHQLETAKAVVVLWSPSSVKSDWVRAEGTVGRERGVLVPAMVRRCVIPVPFNLTHTADLTGWSGDRAHPAYRAMVKELKEKSNKTHVPPLKPPPNRALRGLWRAMAAVAVLAATGASLWVFRPWDAVIAANDPVVKAQRAREASLAKLSEFGVSPETFSTLNWRAIAKKAFRPEARADLDSVAATGDAPALALQCAVAYWSDAPEDAEIARASCRKAAEAGDPAGQVYQAYILHASGDADGAAELMKASAAQGFSWGKLGYAYRLESGDGVARDPQHALELIREVQATGLAEADYALGLFLFRGLAAEPDRAAGLPYIRQAADKGHLDAMLELGRMLTDGYGVEKDFPEARRLLEAVAAQDDDEQMKRRAEGRLSFLATAEAEAAASASLPAPDR